MECCFGDVTDIMPEKQIAVRPGSAVPQLCVPATGYLYVKATRWLSIFVS